MRYVISLSLALLALAGCTTPPTAAGPTATIALGTPVAATATPSPEPTATRPPPTATPSPTATSPPPTPSPEPTATRPPPTATPAPSATRPPPPAAPTATTPPPPAAAGPELEVLALINARRAAAGCAVALAPAPELNGAARGHSEDMAAGDFLDHIGSDGSDPGERIAAAGYVVGAGEPGAAIWAENLAAGYPDPAAVVEGWMASEGHRANMLNCGFREAGVGLAQREGTRYTFYWTAVFTVGR